MLLSYHLHESTCPDFEKINKVTCIIWKLMQGLSCQTDFQPVSAENLASIINITHFWEVLLKVCANGELTRDLNATCEIVSSIAFVQWTSRVCKALLCNNCNQLVICCCNKHVEMRRGEHFIGGSKSYMCMLASENRIIIFLQMLQDSNFIPYCIAPLKGENT